jgi:histone H2A|tara:strand:- start:167 stop:571 length:405 start_codon:yes stop_codon:yes gene_type:complete
MPPLAKTPPAAKALPKHEVKKKSKSKQTKAGLVFPVSRINKTMKSISGLKRIGGSAPVFLTAVIEYVASEILDLAGTHTINAKRKRVTPEDVILGIRSDDELSKLCGSISVYTGDKLKGFNESLKPAPIKQKKA